MNTVSLALIAQVMEMLMTTAAALPAVVDAGRTAVALLQSNTDPTPEQEAQIRAALDAAHEELQRG